MDSIRQVPTLSGGALRLLEVVSATTVHLIRKQTGRSAIGFLSTLGRPLALLATFYAIIEFMGVRGLAIRGNTLTFLLTGILCFLVHSDTVQKVTMAIKRAKSMLHHAPASIFVYVMAQALVALYTNLLAGLLIWLIAEASGFGLGIRNPSGLLLPYFLCWASGLGIGLILLVLGHITPTVSEMIAVIYTRIQFFTCGKFWAANIMPAGLVEYAVWNPLLHTIDQMRGAAFINYTPMHSNMTYPLVFTGIVLFAGFTLEFWVRQRFSLSQTKR
ncbi:MAG: ABC transporter permease [Pseudomonadota bacterium]